MTSIKILDLERAAGLTPEHGSVGIGWWSRGLNKIILHVQISLLIKKETILKRYPENATIAKHSLQEACTGRRCTVRIVA